MRKKIKFQKDGGLLQSTEKTYIPVLNNQLDIWVVTDSVAQIEPTEKQWTVFEKFLNIDNKEFMNALSELENYRQALIEQKEIVKSSKPVRDFNNLHFQWLLLPNQEKTSEEFLLIYAETDWKFRYRQIVVEVEILFTDNKVESAKGSVGLWARSEWDYYYNTNESEESMKIK